MSRVELIIALTSLVVGMALIILISLSG